MSNSNSPALVSFILPAYNEAEIISETLTQVDLIGKALGVNYEIVVIENGSCDATAVIAQQVLAGLGQGKCESLAQGDYGAAMRQGLRIASGEVGIVFDCDLYDEDFARDALAELDGETVSMVVASKRHAASQDNRSVFRKAGTATFSWLIRKMTGMKASDSHGMKVVDLRVARNLVGECVLTGHVFDTELVIRSEKAGFTVAELPCSVDELRPARSSYLSRVIPALKQALQLRQALKD